MPGWVKAQLQQKGGTLAPPGAAAEGGPSISAPPPQPARIQGEIMIDAIKAVPAILPPAPPAPPPLLLRQDCSSGAS